MGRGGRGRGELSLLFVEGVKGKAFQSEGTGDVKGRSWHRHRKSKALFAAQSNDFRIGNFHAFLAEDFFQACQEIGAADAFALGNANGGLLHVTPLNILSQPSEKTHFK